MEIYMKNRNNVAILCDYGLDDAIATLYLLEYAHMFDKIDIVTIGGNFPQKQSLVNAKRILTYFEKDVTNVRIVDTQTAPQSEDSIPEIHGLDGMGDILPDAYAEKVKVLPYDKWLDELDGSYTVVSLGPCTVTADIFRKKGELPLIIMAGNIAEPPNYNNKYEFNHGMDTESFAYCVKFPHKIATLDTCHIDLCNLNLIDLPTEGLLAKMVARYRELSLGRGESICSVYDMVAVVCLVHPERFSVCEATDPQGNLLSVLKYVSKEPIFAN